MVVCIDAMALAPTALGRPVQLYAYTREEADEERRADSVRDCNHALAIVRRLVGGNIVEGRAPTGDVRRLWTVQLQVSNTRRGHSSYRAAYHKEAGCPLPQIDYMMEIYHAVKRVLRECRDDMRREKEAKRKGGAE